MYQLWRIPCVDTRRWTSGSWHGQRNSINIHCMNIIRSEASTHMWSNAWWSRKNRVHRQRSCLSVLSHIITQSTTCWTSSPNLLACAGTRENSGELDKYLTARDYSCGFLHIDVVDNVGRLAWNQGKLMTRGSSTNESQVTSPSLIFHHIPSSQCE